jgi:hypothetical protein
MTNRHILKSVFVVAAAAMAVSACSEDTRDSISTDVESAVTAVGDAVGEVTDDAAGVLARNIATQQGEEQFTNAGHPLDGPLTCTSTISEGADSIEIACTGTTQDGAAAALTGATSEIPGASVVSLEGNFTGTVDGEEVFTTQDLGG